MRRLAAIVVVAAACGSPEEPARPKVGPPATRPAATVKPEPEPEPEVEPLPPEARDRVQALVDAFATGRCDPSALGELRSLVEVHGDAPALVQAQSVAFKVCDDPEALAELTARTLPEDATARQRLQLGAAWLRAARYDEAAAVLVPLAQSEGPTSKAAWLAGFALFHAGDSDAARPLLESARAQAPQDRGDAWLLIGLCKLHDGDIEGATAELEAGTATLDDDPSLWSALARAYAAQDRDDDARRARARARAAHDAFATAERTQARVAARAKALQAAAQTEDVEDVERIFDQMWPDAPVELRVQMLQLRADVYARAGRTDDATADRSKATTLAQTIPPSGDTP